MYEIILFPNPLVQLIAAIAINIHTITKPFKVPAAIPNHLFMPLMIGIFSIIFSACESIVQTIPTKMNVITYAIPSIAIEAIWDAMPSYMPLCSIISPAVSAEESNNLSIAGWGSSIPSCCNIWYSCDCCSESSTLLFNCSFCILLSLSTFSLRLSFTFCSIFASISVFCCSTSFTYGVAAVDIPTTRTHASSE